jgi:hypothetical protein
MNVTYILFYILKIHINKRLFINFHAKICGKYLSNKQNNPDNSLFSEPSSAGILLKIEL